MTSIFNYPHIGLFILAWFISDLFIPLLVKISSSIGAVESRDCPDNGQRFISLLGGLGILFAFVLSLSIALKYQDFEQFKQLFSIVISSFFLVALGIIDDLYEISAVIKLIVLASITALIAQTGLVISFIPDPLEELNLVLTLIWLAGVTSAMNSLDNTDGVAGGITAIIALFIFLIAWKGYNYYSFSEWYQLQKWTSYAGITLCGALLGFLRYNIVRPTIYLGDNGSLFLGFMVGSMAIMGGWSHGDPLRSFFIPCILLAVPMFDLTLSTVLRWFDGRVANLKEAIVYRGKDHVAHRLIALGMSKMEAILFLYLMGFCSGTLALYISHPLVDRIEYVLIVLSGLLFLCLFAWLLAMAPVDQHE